MQRLRFWLVVLFVWFFAVSNIERYHEPINLASFTYVMTGAVVVILIAFPIIHRLSLLLATLLPLPPYFLLKITLGYQVFGQHLPLTVTEVVAIELTILISRQVSQILEDFKAAVVHMMTAHVNNPCNSFETGQDHIYREVHRARQYKHPLAMLTIAPDDKKVAQSLPRFIEEVQRNSIHKYIVAKLAEMLSEQMKKGDIITQRDGHFVTLLPESNRDKAQQLAKRLRSLAQQHLGIDLRFGVSTFPDEEITFEGLLARAEKEMGQASTPHTEHANGSPNVNGRKDSITPHKTTPQTRDDYAAEAAKSNSETDLPSVAHVDTSSTQRDTHSTAMAPVTR